MLDIRDGKIIFLEIVTNGNEAGDGSISGFRLV